MALNTISVPMVALVWTLLQLQNPLSSSLPEICMEIARRRCKLSRSQPEILILPTHYPQQPILSGAQAKIPGSHHLWHLTSHILLPDHQQVLFVPSKHIPQSNHFTIFHSYGPGLSCPQLTYIVLISSYLVLLLLPSPPLHFIPPTEAREILIKCKSEHDPRLLKILFGPLTQSKSYGGH